MVMLPYCPKPEDGGWTTLLVQLNHGYFPIVLCRKDSHIRHCSHLRKAIMKNGGSLGAGARSKCGLRLNRIDRTGSDACLYSRFGHAFLSDAYDVLYLGMPRNPQCTRKYNDPCHYGNFHCASFFIWGSLCAM